MTEEQARKLIDEGNKEGNPDKIAEGLEALKYIHQGQQANNAVNTGRTKEGFVAPIQRTQVAGQRNYARREPINLNKVNAFNMFSDDGTEHRQDKLRPEDRGAWGTAGRGREEVKLRKVECGSCGKVYEVHPSLVKPLEMNEDGSIHNGNICDPCVKRKVGK